MIFPERTCKYVVVHMTIISKLRHNATLNYAVDVTTPIRPNAFKKITIPVYFKT